MSNWATEGINFDGEVHIKDIGKYNIQKVIKLNLDDESENEDENSDD